MWWYVQVPRWAAWLLVAVELVGDVVDVVTLRRWRSRARA